MDSNRSRAGKTTIAFQANLAQQQAEAIAQAAEQRAERLAERLRMMGIDPDI